MTATKIEDSDITSLKIASLPARPTAPTSFGGKGYSAADMQAAFDALPLYIIEAYNKLIDDIGASDSSSVAGVIKTGITALPTLSDLCDGVTDGGLADEIVISGSKLSTYVTSLNTRLTRIETILGI